MTHGTPSYIPIKPHLLRLGAPQPRKLRDEQYPEGYPEHILQMTPVERIKVQKGNSGELEPQMLQAWTADSKCVRKVGGWGSGGGGVVA